MALMLDVWARSALTHCDAHCPARARGATAPCRRAVIAHTGGAGDCDETPMVVLCQIGGNTLVTSADVAMPIPF